MKTNSIFTALLLAATLLLHAAPARAAEYMIFKASATVPLTYVQIGTVSDKIVTKALTGNDLVNLALGRPLGTPVDKNKEMLVLGFTFAGGLDAEQRPITPPLVKLMIYDKTLTGAARKVADLITVTTLDYQVAYGTGTTNKGQGICSGTLLKTPAMVPVPGDSTKNGIDANAVLNGAATVTQPGSGTGGPVTSFNLTATGLTGRLKIRLTSTKPGAMTEIIDGYVLKGTFKTSGARLDLYDE